MTVGPHAVVAIAAHEIVRGQRHVQRRRAAQSVAGRGQHEAHRFHDIARDTQPFAAFANRLPHALVIELLQVAQPAVERAKTVAGGGVAEVIGLDERYAQAAPRRFPRRAHAVDAPSDHDDVVLDARHAFQVPVHTAACGWVAKRP